MKLRPDGAIAINESFLTQSNNQVWSARMDIDEQNNLHIVWAKSSQQVTSSYYTKINGNLDGNGLSMTDSELSIIQEYPYLTNQNIRYPKCVVDNYQNAHSIYEQGNYGCNENKSVYYKKKNAVPLLRIVCPNDSILFVEMTGSGTSWEGIFTPPELGIYDVRVSASDIDGNTGVDFYQFEYIGVNTDDSEIPDSRIVFSNYPNPFNPTTIISFNLTAEHAESAELEIYNLKGQIIKTFVTFQNGGLGTRSAIWDGTDDSGKPVGSGIYFYKLKAGNFTSVRKMLLMK
jgi:hypothetical protein